MEINITKFVRECDPYEFSASRAARFIAELDAIDAMSPTALRSEVARLAEREDFLGLVAKAALERAL